MITRDNFLDDFESFRAHVDQVDFRGMVNPVDNVFYPDISTDIPVEVEQEIVRKLGNPSSYTMFMRLSKEGVEAPHQAHTDYEMGKYACMLYLNRLEHCQGGTSMVSHRLTGMSTHPTTPEQVALWARDTNTPEAWKIDEMAYMIPNRICVFESNRFHRAEPIGGFGQDATDGRIVLTVFIQ